MDSIPSFIYNVYTTVLDQFQNSLDIPLNTSVDNPITLALFVISYIFLLVLLIKIIIGVIRWFYRI